MRFFNKGGSTESSSQNRRHATSRYIKKHSEKAALESRYNRNAPSDLVEEKTNEVANMTVDSSDDIFGEMSDKAVNEAVDRFKEFNLDSLIDFFMQKRHEIAVKTGDKNAEDFRIRRTADHLERNLKAERGTVIVGRYFGWVSKMHPRFGEYFAPTWKNINESLRDGTQEADEPLRETDTKSMPPFILFSNQEDQLRSWKSLQQVDELSLMPSETAFEIDPKKLYIGLSADKRSLICSFISFGQKYRNIPLTGYSKEIPSELTEEWLGTPDAREILSIASKAGYIPDISEPRTILLSVQTKKGLLPLSALMFGGNVIMWEHVYAPDIAPLLDHASGIFDAAKNWKPEGEDFSELIDYLGTLRYLVAHATEPMRGNPTIGDWIDTAMYWHHGFNGFHQSDDVFPDLEAILQPNLKRYLEHYREIVAKNGGPKHRDVNTAQCPSALFSSSDDKQKSSPQTVSAASAAAAQTVQQTPDKKPGTT